MPPTIVYNEDQAETAGGFRMKVSVIGKVRRRVLGWVKADYVNCD